MSIEVRLPLLAEAMVAAKIGAWLKREGDTVVAGEPIVEVETDKTNVEIEAPQSGVLERILVAAGTEGVLVGALLATMTDDDGARSTRATTGRVQAVSSVPRSAAGVLEAPPTLARPDVVAGEPAVVPQADDVSATPVARKIAQLAGLDLNAIRPVAGGRITRADVEAALSARPAAVALPARPAAAPTAASTAAATAVDMSATPSAFEDRPLSAMRKVTAARLQQAKQVVPHFYLQADCRVDALMALRARWNASGAGIKVTVTDVLVFAASRALLKVPAANSAWVETAVRIFHSVDVAVAVNTPKGLITPIVRGAQGKTIRTISRELADLAERARRGALTPDQYTGGTFTISNLGMFGVTSIVPIVNPPSACVLGIGAMESKPVVSGGQIVAGHVMSCTLAADHRAIDGATGAELMTELRRILEDPSSMSLDS